MNSKPTLLMIPCFAGAPWQLDQLARLRGWPMRTLRFARNPITSPVLKALAAVAPFVPGPCYRQLTLRIHANNLKPRFDDEGEIPWSAERTRQFFVRETHHRAYVNCRLIGKDAAGVLLGGIRRSRGVILPRTGHMFRFSHPGRYSEAVNTFLKSAIPIVGDAR